MTDQEFFDNSCKHFAQQKQRCVGKYGSELHIYTGNKKKVLKSIVGKYVNKSEFIKFKSSFLNFDQICLLVAFNHGINYRLLMQMQLAHDCSEDLEVLKNKLIELSKTYKIDTKCIELITEWKK